MAPKLTTFQDRAFPCGRNHALLWPTLCETVSTLHAMEIRIAAPSIHPHSLTRPILSVAPTFVPLRSTKLRTRSCRCQLTAHCKSTCNRSMFELRPHQLGKPGLLYRTESQGYIANVNEVTQACLIARASFSRADTPRRVSVRCGDAGTPYRRKLEETVKERQKKSEICTQEDVRLRSRDKLMI